MLWYIGFALIGLIVACLPIGMAVVDFYRYPNDPSAGSVWAMLFPFFLIFGGLVTGCLCLTRAAWQYAFG